MFLVSASLEALALNEAYRELRQQNVALSEAIRSGADVSLSVLLGRQVLSIVRSCQSRRFWRLAVVSLVLR